MPRPRGEGTRREGGGERAGKALRLFFAVEIGGAARDEAARIAKSLRAAPGGDGLRWVRPENLHVTVRFLGATDPAEVTPLADAVREAVAPHAPFELALGELGWLSGRVVFLELTPAEPLAALAADVERAVAGTGFPGEDRPFRAHVTLGRLRRGSRRPRVTAAVTAAADPFRVEEVVLFESRLDSRGAKYIPLERMALGG